MTEGSRSAATEAAIEENRKTIRDSEAVDYTCGLATLVSRTVGLMLAIGAAAAAAYYLPRWLLPSDLQPLMWSLRAFLASVVCIVVFSCYILGVTPRNMRYIAKMQITIMFWVFGNVSALGCFAVAIKEFIEGGRYGMIFVIAGIFCHGITPFSLGLFDRPTEVAAA